MTNMDPKTWAPIIVLREDSDIASGVTCTWTEAGPQLCCLLCASEMCGGQVHCRQHMGFPLHLRASQSYLLIASLILHHRYLESCYKISFCVLF
jgi:hypothetical protein